MPSVSSLLYSDITVPLCAVALPDWLMSLGSHWLILEFHCLCAKGRGGWAPSQLVHCTEGACALQWSSRLCSVLWRMELARGEGKGNFKFELVLFEEHDIHLDQPVGLVFKHNQGSSQYFRNTFWLATNKWFILIVSFKALATILDLFESVKKINNVGGSGHCLKKTKI